MVRSVRPKMRRYVAIWLVLVLLLTVAPVEAEVATFDGVLRVEWHPDDLSLWPGGRGTVRMTVENTGTEPLRVALVHRGIEGPGGSTAEVAPNYFELAAGAVQRVSVVIQTHPSYLQVPGTSDCHIEILWGRNLTKYGDEPSQVDRDTVDGRDRIVLPVKDVPPGGWVSIAGLVVLLAVISVIAYRRLRADAPQG